MQPDNACPHEAVFSDGKVPCTLPRGHAGSHVYGDILVPFDDEDNEDTLEVPPTMAVLEHWQAQAGHGGCDGFTYATWDDHLSCSCGARIPVPAAAAEEAA